MLQPAVLSDLKTVPGLVHNHETSQLVSRTLNDYEKFSKNWKKRLPKKQIDGHTPSSSLAQTTMSEGARSFERVSSPSSSLAADAIFEPDTPGPSPLAAGSAGAAGATAPPTISSTYDVASTSISANEGGGGGGGGAAEALGDHEVGMSEGGGGELELAPDAGAETVDGAGDAEEVFFDHDMEEDDQEEDGAEGGGPAFSLSDDFHHSDEEGDEEEEEEEEEDDSDDDEDVDEEDDDANERDSGSYLDLRHDRYAEVNTHAKKRAFVQTNVYAVLALFIPMRATDPGSCVLSTRRQFCARTLSSQRRERTRGALPPPAPTNASRCSSPYLWQKEVQSSTPHFFQPFVP